MNTVLGIVDKKFICSNIEFYKYHPYIVYYTKNGNQYEGFIKSLNSKEVLVNRLGYTDSNGNLLEGINTYIQLILSQKSTFGYLQLNQEYIEDMVQVLAMKP
jgi:hypothetical protein